jgi:FdhE protein
MTASVRVLPAEEIAARSGGETAPFVWPERATLFAERAMRLAQLSHGHAMGDFLSFMGELAQAQHKALAWLGQGAGLPLPDAGAIDRAAMNGVPPLDCADWPRDARWREVLSHIVKTLQPGVGPGPAADALARLAAADEVFLERQADALLNGVMAGLDLAAAPVVAAALQVLWTHLVIELVAAHHARGDHKTQPVGRLDNPGLCPCCGSRPTASLTRSGGESTGQRYLHCSLCNTQWHLVRGSCSHCGSREQLAYQSLDLASSDGGEEGSAARAAKAAVQAETCEACGHYLKIVHSDRNPFVDPVADDLASVTLDLLVAETGLQRHGVNLMLLFGAPDGGDG